MNVKAREWLIFFHIRREVSTPSSAIIINENN